MKKSLMFTPLAVLGLSAFVAAAPVSATGSTTINQTIVTAAKADLGNAHDGLTCFAGSPNYCTLAAGDYVVGSDLDFSNSVLRLDNTVTVDFNSHSITTDFGWSGGANAATIDVRGAANVTLKNGTITSDNDGVRALTTENAGATSNLVLNNVNLPGSDSPSAHHPIQFGAGTVTMTNVTNSVANDVSTNDTKLTINSGSYGKFNIDNSEVTINGGTFTGNGGDSALYVGANADMNGTTDNSKLTINGGTFTSAGDKGLEALKYGSIDINGGTFTGAAAGIAIGDYQGNITISGGTFKATGGANAAAITLNNINDRSIADRLLAANHRYTNPSVEVITVAGLGGGTFLAIGGSETSVVASAAINTTTEDANLNAPKSGGNPVKETNAIVSLLPAAFVATLAVLVLAKFVETKNEA